MNLRPSTALVALALAGAATALAAPAHADGASQVQGWTTSSVSLYASCESSSNSTAQVPTHAHFVATITPPAKSYSNSCYEITDDYGRHGFTTSGYNIVTLPADPAQVFTRWVKADPEAKKAKTGFFGAEAGDKVYTLYAGPSDSFDSAGKMDANQTLKAGTPVDTNGSSWIPVQTSDGKLAFVAETAVKPAPAPASPAPASTAAPSGSQGAAPTPGASAPAAAASAPASAAPTAQDESITDKILGLIPGTKTLWVTIALVEAALVLLVAGFKQRKREAKAAEAEAAQPAKASRTRRAEPTEAPAPEAEPEADAAPTLISLD